MLRHAPHLSKMPFFYSPHLSPDHLSRLTSYKYIGEDRSLTYKYLLNPIYTRLLFLLPTFLAPNLITFTGFIISFLTHVLLLSYTPTFSTPAPQYIYFLSAMSNIIYMTLDNLDGKQARRTSSSSPLGHLFDHGCDALNTTLIVMSAIATAQLGPGTLAISVLTCTQIGTFFANLEEFFTGAMILPFVNGPNEGILVLTAVHVAAAVGGPAFWNMQTYLPFLDVPVAFNVLMAYVVYFSTVSTVTANMVTIFQSLRAQGRTPLGALASLLYYSLPIFLFAACFNGWCLLAPNQFADNIRFIMWMSCLVFFELTSRLILATLAEANFPFIPPVFWPTLLCGLNEMGGGLVQGDWMMPLCFWGVGAFCTWRVWCLITQLCAYLNVRCFRLGKLREESVKIQGKGMAE